MRENGHVTKDVTNGGRKVISEGQIQKKIYQRVSGGQFNGGRMVMLGSGGQFNGGRMVML